MGVARYDGDPQWRELIREAAAELARARKAFTDTSRQFAITGTGSKLHTRTCRTLARPDEWTVDTLAMRPVEFAELMNDAEARAWLGENFKRELCRVCSPEIEHEPRRRVVRHRPAKVINLDEYRQRKVAKAKG